MGTEVNKRGGPYHPFNWREVLDFGGGALADKLITKTYRKGFDFKLNKA